MSVKPGHKVDPPARRLGDLVKNCPPVCAAVTIRAGDALNVAIFESDDGATLLTATALFVSNRAEFISGNRRTVTLGRD